jgi:hypothetical protein
MHLPEAPLPTTPWIYPPKDAFAAPHDDDDDDDDDDDNDDGAPGDDDRRRRLSARGPQPSHCSSSEKSCRASGMLSIKQERLIYHYAELTGVELPTGLETMSAVEARSWLSQHWELWKAMGSPTN